MKRVVMVCAICICASYAQVCWSLDGVRISVASSCQQNAQCVSDMDYGAIIAWEDNRNNSAAYDIYAQRVDSSGNLLWTPGGVPVCVDILSSQENIAMCSDDAGGAIIVWQDYRNPTGPDLYAQRIDGAGTCLWQANGVPVCTAADQQREVEIILDGQNGVIIAWADWRDPDPISYSFIYAQRIDEAGNMLWQYNGIPVDTSSGFSHYPSAINDCNGGVYLVWQSARRDTTGTLPADLYLQHINGLGNSLLAINGQRIFGESTAQSFPKVSWSVQHTIIVSWTDSRNWQTTGQDIYALRIDTLGSPLWDSTGLPVCAADSSQALESVTDQIADGRGGIIIYWRDKRHGDYDIYAQRIDTVGSQLWDTNGVPVCTLARYQYPGPAVSDDSSGVILKFVDNPYSFYEEYVQRIDPTGLLRWGANGLRACTVSTTRTGPGFCTDGSGGAITAWTDARYGTFDLDIWGQRVNDGHAPGVTESSPISMNIDFGLQILPNPFTRTTRIRYSILDTRFLIQDPTISIYDVTGCLVKSFAPESSIENQEPEVVWDGTDHAGKQLPAGVYFCRLSMADKTIIRKVVLLKEK